MRIAFGQQHWSFAACRLRGPILQQSMIFARYQEASVIPDPALYESRTQALNHVSPLASCGVSLSVRRSTPHGTLPFTKSAFVN